MMHGITRRNEGPVVIPPVNGTVVARCTYDKSVLSSEDARVMLS